jgi:anaerobic magnesium-protoporphyrin IX monomethyl ester cyclase
MPAWDLVNIESYRSVWLRHHGYFSLNVATTRGCPFKCNWCAKPIYGNRYNSRSPLHVVKEIGWLLDNYHPDHIWFCDDIFGLKPGWVSEFRDLVKLHSLRFRYKIQSRVDLLLEEDATEALAQSGADTVWVGAESGSQKILDAMDKGTTVAQIAQATSLLKSRNIRVAFFLQFGYLGETRDDINETIGMVLHLMPDEIGISVSYPLPGTKFYERVKGEMTAKQNWSDSDDLAMMFHSTYPPRFYKVLHRYVHNLYRVRRGAAVLKNFRSSGRPIRNLMSMMYNLPVSWINAARLDQLVHAPERT